MKNRARHIARLDTSLHPFSPVRLSDEVIQQLDETAASLGTNRAALIRLCLTAFLEAFGRHGSVVLPLDWTKVVETMDGRRTRKAADNPGSPADVGNSDGYGMARGSMMGQGRGAGRGAGQGMMMGARRGAGPDPEHLAQMPPQAAFMHLAETCNECHTRFRVEE